MAGPPSGGLVFRAVLAILSVGGTALAADDGPPLLLRAPLRAAAADPVTGRLFALAGAAAAGEFADASRESDGRGIVLDSAQERGSVTWQVTGLDRAALWVGAMELVAVPEPADYVRPPNVAAAAAPPRPPAAFPDRWRALDGNPNHIQEQDFTWHIPLEPRENPARVAMDATNSNRGLPGRAIGVAVNGIILHNPFDERIEMDAVWRTDRCCGHPSPLQAHHYHKYPVCLNTPWADDGEGHSPLIGFMFDGFPVYGPGSGVNWS